VASSFDVAVPAGGLAVGVVVAADGAVEPDGAVPLEVVSVEVEGVEVEVAACEMTAPPATPPATRPRAVAAVAVRRVRPPTRARPRASSDGGVA
jgi:hypothetical protein